ncbi:COG4223 family protein [Defluviimonas sp. SAOS-178_SWC]|uniref:COG4223 family protein n=1 Tax=Defluviimonas sp. SAOS-178_SWC TaxID=3121287 RepID=UPI003221F669
MARAKKDKAVEGDTPAETEPSESAELIDTQPQDVEIEKPGEQAEDAVSEGDETVILTEPAATETPEQDSIGAEPQPEPRAAGRKGGFVPMVLGGVIAAGLGFGAAAYVLPRFWVPDQRAAEFASVREELAAQAARISGLDTDLGKIKSDTTAGDVAAGQAALAARLDGEITALRTSVSALDEDLKKAVARFESLDVRLSEIEKRPVEGGAASATALEAFGREMADLRAEIDAQRAAAAQAQQDIAATASAATEKITAAEAEASRLRDEAEAVTRRGAARGALSRIQAALESGGALEGALADLASSGVDVPPALADQAQGVPSLGALRAAFPPAAREALAISLKETAGGGTWDRITAFLRSQSGARSLSPRAGDDPDAVLSRAEAALTAGALTTAIEEIAKLPPAGQARMAEWVDMVNRRISATDAAAMLAKELQ